MKKVSDLKSVSGVLPWLLGWNGRTVSSKGCETSMTKQTWSRCGPRYSLSQFCFCKVVYSSPYICHHLRWQAWFHQHDHFSKVLLPPFWIRALIWGGKCLSCHSALPEIQGASRGKLQEEWLTAAPLANGKESDRQIRQNECRNVFVILWAQVRHILPKVVSKCLFHQ